MTTLAASLASLLGPAGNGPSPAGLALPVAAPVDEAELLELLAFARSEQLRVIPMGSGTGLTRWRAGTGADFALSTRRLTGVLAFEPDDGTLAARAGTPLHELAELAAGSGHHLSPRLRHAPTASLGGVLSAGRAGPDRLRLGPPRHQLLGTRIALSDGTVAASGGRLVKNVAGFDLHRLHCGSRGTLGIILEACLRLHPAPEVSSRLATRFAGPGQARAAAELVRRGPLRPWALVLEELTGTDGSCTLHLELGGAEQVHAAELAWVRAAMAELNGATLAPASGEELDHWADGAGARLTVTCQNSRLAAVAPLLAELVPGPQVTQPDLSQIHVFGHGPPLTEAERHPLAQRLARQGARITGHARAAEPGAEWSARIRGALDPLSMFAETEAGS